MLVRTITFTGTVKNTGNVAASYRVRLHGRRLPADPMDVLSTLGASTLLTLDPGITGNVTLTIPGVAMNSGPEGSDQIDQLYAALDLTAPLSLSDIAPQVTRAVYTEPAPTTTATLGGSISIASKAFAAGVFVKGRRHLLMDGAVAYVTR